MLTSQFPLLSLSQSSTLILDSGAACSVVSTNISNHFHNISGSSLQVATAADGHHLQISGEGKLGPLDNVLLSDNISHNCISISQLCDHDYTITFTKSHAHIQHPNAVITGQRIGGLYTLPVEDFLSLNFSSSVLNIGSQIPDVDVLDLWHRRLADTAHRVIRESVRTKLIEGIVLDRKYFNAKHRKSYRCPCDICTRAKCIRFLFQQSEIDWPVSFLDLTCRQIF